MTDTELKCRNAKEAAKKLSTASANDKNKALLLIAEELKSNKDYILSENDKDMKAAEKNGLPKVLLDRLLLSPDRIDGMAKGVIEVADLPDPVGKTLSDITRPNGLRVKKVSVPLGVIAVIFEARPNVTSDAASLCLKSGNCSVLRGGKEAIHSNTAIFNVMRAALKKSPLPEDCIQFITDISHESANELMTMNKYVDVLIPRGSARLIGTVVKNSTVPVIETGVGNCHIYVDKDADLDMAADIIFNAKTSRPSVCNAAESLLIHKDVAEKALKLIKKRLDEKNVELRGDKTSKEILPDIKEASEDDWGREYLDYIMSVKIVDNIDEAIEHIYKYGTGHSECIVTENLRAAERFTARPGDRVYGPLTVLAGYYYEVTKLMELSRDMYYPQPDVDSVVLKLTAKGAEKLFELEWLLNRAFAMRRKTLSNNLRAAGISDERLKSLLGACGIEGNIRAEKLTVAQFANIAREIEAHGK